jgi:hypothetical protein
MQPARPVAVALLGVLVALVAACGYGTPAEFTAADLPRIVLHADEAPPGTRIADLGGPRHLGGFAHDAAERAALRRDGFVAGYVVFFPPLSYFRHLPHADTDVAYQVIAGVFGDDDGASASLNRYVADLRTRQMEGVSDLSAPGLGDDAFALVGFAVSDGSPLRVYAWRVRNLLLALVASGPVDAGEALALARTMDDRAV